MVTTALGIAAASWALQIGYFVVLLVGFGLWVSYGAARHDLPLVVPNSVAFVVMGGTITVALRTR